MGYCCWEEYPIFEAHLRRPDLQWQLVHVVVSASTCGRFCCLMILTSFVLLRLLKFCSTLYMKQSDDEDSPVRGGGCVVWLKSEQEMCSKAFGGKELSTTMNADECVARGHDCDWFLIHNIAQLYYTQRSWFVVLMLSKSHLHPPENFLYKMGGLKALTSMSFCSERLFFCIFMYFKND